MQSAAVKPYYDALRRKPISRFFKRLVDWLGAFVLTVILSPVLLVVAIMVKLDSKGPVFYCQERLTRYGKPFRIVKFRTMVTGADKMGALVTADQDPRITAVGRRLRHYRLDELPQLFNVLAGQMSFVGTRPEVKRYVDCYTPEMYATLLMPAGITSEASICFKDEAEILSVDGDTDGIYVTDILPRKMALNLQALKQFSFWRDLKTAFRTIIKVFQ
ncbi:MAG TPA: sugar transferase [Clostridiaceae bacterium]|nr:sugar transferase [Clostridiaceae bacterium]